MHLAKNLAKLIEKIVRGIYNNEKSSKSFIEKTMKKYISCTFVFLYSLSSLFGCSLDDLTVEEKVGQLLIVHFRGEKATEEAAFLINNVNVGGFIYYQYSNTLSSPRQIRQLSMELQTLASKNKNKIPLFIAADQEGGVVTRFTNGFTTFPGNKALAMAGSIDLAKKYSFALAEESQKVGLNFNLAPVADVNQPKNPIIGIRSFGDDATQVAQFVQASLFGFKKAGILSCIKHFPGHGDVIVDSHQDLPCINKTKQDLYQKDLVPFLAAKNLTDAIMTGHLFIPAIDPDTCTTLSSKCIDLIRNELKFDGVVITDSLVMEGVLKKCPSVDECAIRALEAGHDILLLGGRNLTNYTNITLELTLEDIKRIHANIVQAVKEGRIPLSRLNDAVRRILELKKRIAAMPETTEVEESVSSDAHQELAQEVAKKALRFIGKPQEIDIHSCALIAPDNLKNTILKTGLQEKIKDVVFYENTTLTEKEQTDILELAKEKDSLLLYTCNAWKNPVQEKLLRSLLQLGKKTVVIIARDTLDAECIPEAPYIILTHSPTLPSLQAAMELIVHTE